MKIIVMCALAAAAGAAGAAGRAPAPDPLGLLGRPGALALGAPALSQTLSVAALAPGVTHYTVWRGAPQPGPTWQLLGEVALDDAALAHARACFAAIGLTARVRTFHIAGAPATPYRIAAGGAYASREAAAAAAGRAAPDCRLAPRDRAAEEGNRGGPWRVDIVALEPDKARGRWSVAASPDGARTRTSELARAAGALVAVNGGFFVEKADDGYPGQAAGVSVLAGRVASAPVAERPAVLLGGPSPRIVGTLAWQAWLEWPDGERTPLDGVNRPQGRVRNCGRGPGDLPIHDHTCDYPDDLVIYPAGSPFAARESGAAGSRFALAASGTLRELAPAEQPGAGEALLTAGAAGGRAAGLRRSAAQGARAVFRLDSGVGTEAALLARAASLVNAGPALLANGTPLRQDARQGWAVDATREPAHRLLMHDWINQRNPRTALGVRADGTVLLVTVDGHRHDSAVGLTIEELRRLMASLGAADAVNLDGGGSTALAIRGRLANRPSDRDGERKVGDAILFTTDGHDDLSNQPQRQGQ